MPAGGGVASHKFRWRRFCSWSLTTRPIRRNFVHLFAVVRKLFYSPSTAARRTRYRSVFPSRGNTRRQYNGHTKLRLAIWRAGYLIEYLNCEETSHGRISTSQLRFHPRTAMSVRFNHENFRRDFPPSERNARLVRARLDYRFHLKTRTVSTVLSS